MSETPLMTDIEKLAEKAKLWPATNGEGDGLSSAYVGNLLTDLAATLRSEHEARVRAERERDCLREVKDIRDGITDALEAAGYFHMSNAEGVASICSALAAAEARVVAAERSRDEAVRLLRGMANAADDVGVVHLDTDDPTRETEELIRATHATRAFLSTLPPAPPAPEDAGATLSGGNNAEPA